MVRLPHIEIYLPNLRPDNYSAESPRDTTYNCIAWAADINNLLVWPATEGYHWPPGIPQAETIEAFISYYEAQGYEVCDTADLEQNYRKVAIYCDEDGGDPLHAARQLPSGQWTSKLGAAEDIIHDDLHAIEDGYGQFYYGRAIVFMKSPVSPT